jgi:hypothetical protein
MANCCKLFLIAFLTLLVPGVDSSHVPGFLGDFLKRFYAIMAKLFELK